MKKRRRDFRLSIQILSVALTNGYIVGFLKGKIYQGSTKQLCVPGLSCYSCPGALGACPIGALQAVISSSQYQVSFYVIGFLMLFGALVGRVVCGFFCPFGLIQDLIHKIPFPFRKKILPGEKYLHILKYIILAIFVIILPMVVVNVIGQGDPWFCKWICPSGTLFGGIPLLTSSEDLRGAVGYLFQWKFAVLAFLLLSSLIVYRPFCRYLCPLGAIYSFFNPVSLYRYEIDEKKCTKCNKCKQTCKMDIPIFEKPNSLECIRCGECIGACPHQAISKGYGIKLEKENH